MNAGRCIAARARCATNMSSMLAPRVVPLTLLLALSLVACDKNSGESGTVCPTDAMMCPDGTGVGRQGPNCEFAPCPGETPAAPQPE
jgi:hypothetical protein